jgi:hypothetical protein
MDRVEPKSGLRSTEFYVAVVAMGIGGAAMFLGHPWVGGLVVSAVAVGYAVARSLDKRAAHLANGETNAAVASSRSRTV